MKVFMALSDYTNIRKEIAQPSWVREHMHEGSKVNCGGEQKL